MGVPVGARARLEGDEGRGDGAWRQTRGIDEAARAIAHEFGETVRRAEIATVSTDGLGQRTHLQRDLDRRLESVDSQLLETLGTLRHVFRRLQDTRSPGNETT